MSTKPSSTSRTKSCPVEFDEVEQADSFAAREAPQQRKAPAIDQRSIYRQPRFAVVPRRRRRAQHEGDRGDGLRCHGKRCTREQHHDRPAPCQRSGLPPLEQGLASIRVHDPNPSAPDVER